MYSNRERPTGTPRETCDLQCNRDRPAGTPRETCASITFITDVQCNRDRPTGTHGKPVLL